MEPRFGESPWQRPTTAAAKKEGTLLLGSHDSLLNGVLEEIFLHFYYEMSINKFIDFVLAKRCLLGLWESINVKTLQC